MKNNLSKTQETAKAHELYHSLPNGIKAMKSKLGKSITNTVKKIKDEAKPIKKHTSSYIKNNPYKALGFVVVVTFLLSKLL